MERDLRRDVVGLERPRDREDDLAAALDLEDVDAPVRPEVADRLQAETQGGGESEQPAPLQPERMAPRIAKDRAASRVAKPDVPRSLRPQQPLQAAAGESRFPGEAHPAAEPEDRPLADIDGISRRDLQRSVPLDAEERVVLGLAAVRRRGR